MAEAILSVVEIRENFSPDFLHKNSQTDVCFQWVLHALSQGRTPYQIIEQLIRDRQETQQRIDEYLLYHSAPTIIVS